MDEDSTSRAAALEYLTEAFSEAARAACADGRGMEAAEDACVAIAHGLSAEALSAALERMDDELCSSLPGGVRVHDRRPRTLATKVGDVSFRCRRCRDAAGNAVVPLADTIDVPWGARISPSAAAFLVQAGARVSYAGAAALLSMAGGSAVSVTGLVHGEGALCAAEDASAAESLFGSGVIPGADCEADEICVEADGTWFRLQHAPDGEPKRVEVKALVAYQGKSSSGGRASRVRAVRHGCVAAPAEFWREGVAAVGSRFDLSKVERCHLGSDGEAAYGAGGSFLPCGADRHIDPFHVNRAVLSCFGPGERRLGSKVLSVAMEGEAASAAALLEAARAHGLANANAERVAAYLRNNAEYFATCGAHVAKYSNEHLRKPLRGGRQLALRRGALAAGASCRGTQTPRQDRGRDLRRVGRGVQTAPAPPVLWGDPLGDERTRRRPLPLPLPRLLQVGQRPFGHGVRGPEEGPPHLDRLLRADVLERTD